MNDLERIIHILNTVPLYRCKNVDYLVNLVLPAIRNNQYLIISNNETPLYFVTWTFLCKKASDEYEAKERLLRIEDWNSGVIPWIIDCVCPYGGIFPAHRELVKILRDSGVKGKVRFFRYKRGNNELRYIRV
jgi:hemolysin-activating ACP:hemolysin acyltransferase|tara:strand:- start:2575 stop:2970 length:396 start_codon:yes stop_codon:yes gene_type:complete